VFGAHEVGNELCRCCLQSDARRLVRLADEFQCDDMTRRCDGFLAGAMAIAAVRMDCAQARAVAHPAFGCFCCREHADQIRRPPGPRCRSNLRPTSR